MLLLVTILLVVVAAVTLLIGIFSDELALIFISIGASALAAIVLAVLSQMSRKKGRAAAAEATAPEPLPARQQPADAGQDVAADAAASIEEIGEPVTRVEAEPAAPRAATGELPIANYDGLRVNEILPQLERLDLDELEAVAQHEESRKNRTTVLNRIDALMDQLEASGAPAATAATAATTAAPASQPEAVPATDVSDELAEEAAASIEEIGEPVVVAEEEAAGEADATPATADGFPIPNYDSLTEDELIPMLAGLDADQLEAVADREEAGPNRDAVLDAIDDRLDILEGIVPAPAASPAAEADDTDLIEAELAADEPDVLPVEAAAAPVKRATAKKAAAKKAPARKAAAPVAKKAATKAAKKAAPAKATKKTLEPAKKAPAATRATKAAPAAGAVKAVTPATGTTAAAKKAPAKKTTAAEKATKS